MKKTYTKAVSATLASALAVGMVPAMALADEAVDQEMELLLSADEQLTAKGEIVLATGYENGHAFPAGTKSEDVAKMFEGVLPYGAEDEVEAEYYYVQIASDAQIAAGIVGANQSAANGKLFGSGTAFTIEGENFFALPGSSVQNQVAPVAPGEYAVMAKVGNVWVEKAVSYTVAAGAIADVYLYEEVEEGKKELFADTTFTYDGEAIPVTLTDGDEDVTDLFTYVYYKSNVAKSASELVDAGTYKVVATGKAGQAYAGQTATLELVINPFSLSQDAKLASDFLAGTSAPTLKLNPNDDLVLTGYKNALGTPGENVMYFAPGKDANADNYTGTGALSFVTVGKDVSASIAISYGTAATLPSKINYAAGDKAFNESLVSVTIPDQDFDGKVEALELGTDCNLKVMKQNADGTETEVGVAGLASSGTYHITAVIDAENYKNWAIGGESAEWELEVTAGDVAIDGIAFIYDNDNLETADALTGANALYYDGKDKMDKLAITVWDESGKQVASSDYTVTVKKTLEADGTTKVAVADQVVDGIVDAGTYTVTVSSSVYTIAGQAKSETITIEVKPAPISGWSIDDDYKTGAVSTFFYTGAEIVPGLVWGHDADAKTAEVAVPTDAYEVVISKFVDAKGVEAKKAPAAFKEIGTYTISVIDKDTKDNWAFNKAEDWSLIVSDKNLYSDVATDVWYASPVYQAKDLGYMGGFAGTNNFGPMQSIKRGDFMCVLGNMANFDATKATDKISFSDVASTAYYAANIAWAQNTGIANGYPDGTFAPEKSLSREEAAAFFANYAKALGNYVAPTAAEIETALAAYPDGAKVSNWAKEVVAWAVINDVMGNGKTLNPKGTITRAETAAMAVNYQPAKLATDTVLKGE